MKTKTFESTVKKGDTILVYYSHTYYDYSRHDEETYTFMGYSACGGCPGEPCPGHVKLQHKNGKMKSTGGCYRNNDNIRLRIMPGFLPDDLFEV